MIINIRGTSGSGKSYIIHNLKKLYIPYPIMMEGRKRPIGYRWECPGKPPVFIVGHYETACGGCDTVKTLDQVFQLVKDYHQMGTAGYGEAHVIFEGLLISADVKRTAELHTLGLPLTVISLDTPLQVCLDGITQRRQEKGNEKPVNPKNTESKFKAVVKTTRDLAAQGVDCHTLNREDALKKVMGILGW